MRQRISTSSRLEANGRYSPSARVLAVCLLFAAVTWDYTACLPGLQDLPALLCQRLGHHSGPAPAGMPCCPAPASLPAQHPAQKSCCEAPASSQDAIPSAKQDGTRDTTCSMQVVALSPLPQTNYLPRQLHRGDRYEREVFDQKMDMRI